MQKKAFYTVQSSRDARDGVFESCLDDREQVLSLSKIPCGPAVREGPCSDIRIDPSRAMIYAALQLQVLSQASGLEFGRHLHHISIQPELQW